MSENDGFRNPTREEYETALKGLPPVDLYVYLSTSKKHLVFVEAGLQLSEAKLQSLQRLGAKNLFVRKVSAAVRPLTVDEILSSIPLELDPRTAFDGETLGLEAELRMKESYRQLIELPPTQAAVPVTELVSKMSAQLLKTLAPDNEELKITVLKNLRNVRFMNHSAAMSTLAVLCAVANDFRAKSVFQSLLQATLLMDAALADLDEVHLETYYRNRKELPAHILDRIHYHPVKSQQMVAYLPIHTDALSQLILHHHELHNGRGYHRGIRTSQVLPLARVLSLAVDIYEQLKASEMNGDPLSLKQVLTNLQEPRVEPHERRHNSKLIENVFIFLGLRAV